MSYQEEYQRWMNADLIDVDLKTELRSIKDDDNAIKERFAVALQFGTAGLRGTLGAGTNRMNIWVVRQATQGVADWVKTQGGTQTVALSYDSRLKGWNFAREAAGVLAANGVNVRIYDELMPVPALSFATRYYHCNAGIMTIAEDSSDYPKVTGSLLEGGLGFDYKWDLGWMNDTLKYYATDPIYRNFDHHKLTFSMAYFYSERFLMPLSHDENVHGKKTIVDRMWGDYDAKFSQVRNLYAYMYAHPGKKLNFMGNEIASFREFDEKKELDWFLLDYPRHQKFAKYFHDEE